MPSTAPTESREGSDPFDLAYEYQLAVVRHVRQGVKNLVTVRERIEMQLQERQNRASALEKESEAITATCDEAYDQESSSRRAVVREQIVALKTDIDLIAAQEQSLRTTSRRLQQHIEQFRIEKEVLKASYTTADALISAIETRRVTSTGA